VLVRWLQERSNLIKDLACEHNTCRAHGQAGNLQTLGCPCIAGMTEIVRSRRGIEDALRKGACANATWGPFFVHRQIVPQMLRETYEAIGRHVYDDNIGTAEKHFGRHLEGNVIPLSTQHYPMLQRNLVYTGVTRGKRLVVLVGQRKALAIAVKGSRARRRWSKLREWLATRSSKLMFDITSQPMLKSRPSR
jgi:UvrD-like helicase C-terminal domain